MRIGGRYESRQRTGCGGWLSGVAACALMVVVAAPTPGQAQGTGASLDPADPYTPKWQSWVELGGYYGSDDDSRGEGVFWTPLAQTPVTLFFAELRGKFFEDEVHEGNFALGYRQMLPSGWNAGLWAGVDVRNTEVDNTFWQASGGLEMLNERWDARVNGYLPATDSKLSPGLAEVRLERNNIFMIGGREVPLAGFDGEIGYRLFATPETASGRRHELRVYGGGFWFDDNEAVDEVAGPKARLEWRIADVLGDWTGSQLTLETEYSYDDLRDDNWEVGARLRLPLGAAPDRPAALSPQERRMAEGLERDTDIVTAPSQEPVADALTDVRFDRVAYVDGGSITGTSSDAGDNTLVIANGDIDGPQELQGAQTLQGGGATIQVRGQRTGVVTGFTAPGDRPNLANPGDNPNLTLTGNRTHVAGLSIQGAGFGNFGNHGISAEASKNNVVIEQTHIADAGNFGIAFLADGNTNVTIADTTIAEPVAYGILFNGNDNRRVTIADTTVTEADSGGVSFIDNNRDITIAGLTVSDSAEGIFFGDGNRGVTIADASITNVSNDGIDFRNDNRDVTIADTRITETGDAGITFSDGNRDVTISDASISDTGDIGIIFLSSNRNMTVASTTITDAGDRGILFDDHNFGVTIDDTTIADAGADGIWMDGNNRDVSITRTTIANVGTEGIRMASNNDVSLEDVILAGSFGDDGIAIPGTANTLSGAGNVAADATFGNMFCDAAAGQTGAFEFDIGTCP